MPRALPRHPRLCPDLPWRRLPGMIMGALLPLPTQIPWPWGWRNQLVASDSLRAGWCALLEILRLGPGDAVLGSALTIPDMARLCEASGASWVGVDADLANLIPGPQDLRRAHVAACQRGLRPRVLVVAQLFGRHADIQSVARCASELGLLVVEDCAQCHPQLWRPSKGVAVTGFSFGAIKSATALGGGLWYVADDSLRQQLQATMAAWPQRRLRQRLLRVLRGGMLRCCATPLGLAALAVCGLKPENLLVLARGFPGARQKRDVCWQIDPGVERSLRRSLRWRRSLLMSQRRQLGRLAAMLPLERLPGQDHGDPAWLLPLCDADPTALRRLFYSLGQDCGGMGSLEVCTSAEYPCPKLARMAGQTLVLPYAQAWQGQHGARLWSLIRRRR